MLPPSCFRHRADLPPSARCFLHLVFFRHLVFIRYVWAKLVLKTAIEQAELRFKSQHTDEPPAHEFSFTFRTGIWEVGFR